MIQEFLMLRSIGILKRMEKLIIFVMYHHKLKCYPVIRKLIKANSMKLGPLQNARWSNIRFNRQTMALSSFRDDNAQTKEPIQFCRDFQQSHCTNIPCLHVHGTITEEESFLR